MADDELYKGFWIDFYDKLISEDGYCRTFPIVRDMIRKYKPDAKVILELACGTGRYTEYFVTAGFAVKGIDISPDAIARARTRVKNARFVVQDMASIREPQIYDAAVCLFESFRYNRTYEECEKTLIGVFRSLKATGLFLCDFGYWPPTKKATLHNEVYMGQGLTVLQDEVIRTEGDYDVRADRMTFKKQGKILKTEDIERAPLLRISESKMRKMLSNTGFKTLAVGREFRGYPESMLFIAQKII